MRTSRSRPPKPLPSIPAEQALSFLKDTRGLLTWTARDLAKALRLSLPEANEVLAVLEAQGYVKRVKEKGEWLTTPAGESVSGSKLPRFTRESVERALAALVERIKTVNRDPKSPFIIPSAVAFGDFLSDLSRVQAADVGIELKRRGSEADSLIGDAEAKVRRTFLRQLRGKDQTLNVRPFREWMSKRAHCSLGDSK